MSRVVESESELGVGQSVESHVSSWSRSRFSKLLESESGIGVGFLNLLESELVFQNCWSRSQESEHLLQLPTPMFINILNYNINCLKIITGVGTGNIDCTYSECP